MFDHFSIDIYTVWALHNTIPEISFYPFFITYICH